MTLCYDFVMAKFRFEVIDEDAEASKLVEKIEALAPGLSAFIGKPAPPVKLEQPR